MCSVTVIVGWIWARVCKRVRDQRTIIRVVENKTGHRVRIIDPPMGRVGWGDSLSPGTPLPLMSPFENQLIGRLDFLEPNTHSGP